MSMEEYVQMLGIKLLPPQRELLKKLCESDRPLYVVYPPKFGYSLYLGTLHELMKILMTPKED